MLTVAIVDFGLGNVASIRNMFHRLGVTCELSRDPAVLADAERLVLPGVGAFDAGMTALREKGLDAVVRAHVVERRRPLLGICLGMQMLVERSEEGVVAGLGLVPGRVERLPQGTGEKIPHMGWNHLTLRRTGALFRPRTDEAFAELELPLSYYFVHSYHVVCQDPADVVATARHGIEFCAALERGNVFGVQFHPEKSHRYGMLCLRNFAEVPAC